MNKKTKKKTLTKTQKFKKTGTKSKERVKKSGEVFTPGWCVHNMLEMAVKHGDAFKNINETFLEPACGDGNFIIQIVERKMHIVDSLYPCKEDYKNLTINAVSKIYGIDIMDDNVEECKDRVMRNLKKRYLKRYNENMPQEHENNLRYVLDNNIILGNFLTAKTNDNKPIVICNYVFDNGLVARSDFYLQDMLDNPENNKPFKIYGFVPIKDISSIGGEDI